jgi:cysteine synthase A
MLMKAYGAEVVLTDGKLGMQGSIVKAEGIAKEIEGAFIPSQFENPSNPEAHYKTTGVEIWNDTDGKVDIFVAGIGTGGTLSGAGKFLKEKNPDVKIIGVEPAKSPLLTGGKSGSHGIQGIGANFIPGNLNREIYDEIIDVSDENAYKYARIIAKEEGVLVGISSGATLCGALELAKRPENKGKTIVALLTDTGERYLSTGIYEE